MSEQVQSLIDEMLILATLIGEAANRGGSWS